MVFLAREIQLLECVSVYYAVQGYLTIRLNPLNKPG